MTQFEDKTALDYALEEESLPEIAMVSACVHLKTSTCCYHDLISIATGSGAEACHDGARLREGPGGGCAVSGLPRMRPLRGSQRKWSTDMSHITHACTHSCTRAYIQVTPLHIASTYGHTTHTKHTHKAHTQSTSTQAHKHTKHKEHNAQKTQSTKDTEQPKKARLPFTLPIQAPLIPHTTPT